MGVKRFCLWLEDELAINQSVQYDEFEVFSDNVAEMLKNDDVAWGDVTSQDCKFMEASRIFKNILDNPTETNEVVERITSLFSTLLDFQEDSLIDVFWLSNDAEKIESNVELLKILRRLRVTLRAKISLFLSNGNELKRLDPNLFIVFNTVDTLNSLSAQSRLLWRGGMTVRGQSDFICVPGVSIEIASKSDEDFVDNIRGLTLQDQILVLDFKSNSHGLRHQLQTSNFQMHMEDQFGVLDKMVPTNKKLGLLMCLLVPSSKNCRKHMLNQKRRFRDIEQGGEDTSLDFDPDSFNSLIYFVQKSDEKIWEVQEVQLKKNQKLAEIVKMGRAKADSSRDKNLNKSGKKENSGDVPKDTSSHDIYYNVDERTERHEEELCHIVKRLGRKELKSSCLGTSRQDLRHMCLNLPSKRLLQRAKEGNGNNGNASLAVDKKNSTWSAKKKSDLRMTITDALDSCDVSSDSDLFKPAFNKMFRICHTILDDVPVAKITLKLMTRVAFQFAQTVIDFQKMAENGNQKENDNRRSNDRRNAASKTT